VETKHIAVTVEKAVNSEFDARFVMSAATPDRVKDTIDVKAYDSATKIDKLIALFNHDPNQVAGYWTGIKAAGDTLSGSIKFASTSLGQMLKTLIDEGVPMGASIGFRGKGEPNKQGGIHFKEIELLETSIVSTPCHPRAMQIAKSFGIELPGESEFEIDTEAAALPVESQTKRKAVAALTIANATLSIKGNTK
jgi:HK97 family phage prohead protease